MSAYTPLLDRILRPLERVIAPKTGGKTVAEIVETAPGRWSIRFGNVTVGGYESRERAERVAREWNGFEIKEGK